MGLIQKNQMKETLKKNYVNDSALENTEFTSRIIASNSFLIINFIFKNSLLDQTVFQIKIIILKEITLIHKKIFMKQLNLE